MGEGVELDPLGILAETMTETSGAMTSSGGGKITTPSASETSHICNILLSQLRYIETALMSSVHMRKPRRKQLPYIDLSGHNPKNKRITLILHARQSLALQITVISYLLACIANQLLLAA